MVVIGCANKVFWAKVWVFVKFSNLVVERVVGSDVCEMGFIKSNMRQRGSSQKKKNMRERERIKTNKKRTKTCYNKLL